MKYLLPSGKFLFLCFLIFYIGIGYCFTYVLEIYHNDALSRTALAFFTIYGRDPHLAAIGFVWQPLPSLLQIPFLQLFKPFNLMLLSGPVVTSICGALCVAVIYKTGQLLYQGNKSFSGLLIALLFGLNPLIILYSSIGTSEMVFLIFLLLSSYFLIKYYYSHNQSNLLMASGAIALSFWSRYEALPAFAGSVLVITLHLLLYKKSFRTIESTLLQYALPFFYSVLIWILANWLIMKDPFYFMNSPYSNASFTTAFKTNPGLLENSYHSFINSLRYGFNRVLYLAPVIWLIPALGIPVVKNSDRRLRNLVLLCFITLPFAAIILFHTWQLYKGESFGWLRFFIYAIPMGTLLAFYFARRHTIMAILAIAFMAISIYTTWFSIVSPHLGREENSFAQKLIDPNAQLDFSRTYLDQKTVALFMDKLPGKILLDTDKGFAIPLFAKNPNRYIITSDIDYQQIVRSYSLHTDWLILPQPVSDDRGQNKIYEFHPGIWEGNAPDITLYKQIEGWRIFKVNRKVESI